MNRHWSPNDFLDDETPGSKNPQKLARPDKKDIPESKKAREGGFVFIGEEDTAIPGADGTPIPDTSFLTEEKAEEIEEAEEIVEAEENEEDSKKETTWVFQDETFAPEGSSDEEVLEVDEEELNPSPEKEGKLSSLGNLFDWLKSFIFSLTAVIFIFTLLFRGVTVNGNSMLPTLENGQYLIISDLLYTPKNGDIVVVQAPDYKEGKEPLIKRVIATEGQEVKINFLTWQVFIDGVELNETYILKDDYTTMNCEDMRPDENGEVKFTVEEGCVFLMGDHRNDSLDSRSEMIGQIDERYIMGRVILRVTPFSKLGKVD